MSAEFAEIEGFLANIPPFNSLPLEAQQDAAKQVAVYYYRSNSNILTHGGSIRDLYIVRSGVVEIYDSGGALYNRLPEGKLFGQFDLLNNKPVHFAATALEDCLIYCLPKIIFFDFCKKYQAFANFVEADNSTRLKHAVATAKSSSDLITAKVTDLLHRAPVRLPVTATIKEAAKVMKEKNVSSLLVVKSNEHMSGIAGIVTAQDFCTRVAATGQSYEAPIANIMTPNVITLDHHAYVFEAMLTMLRNNTHHLPVVRKRMPIGIVNLEDIVSYQSQHSLLLVSQILQQNSVKELTQLSQQIKDSFRRMVNEGANANVIGTTMAAIGRSYKQRLLELAENRLGPPPVPYCFLTPGSMARNEQLVATGQNNAMILDNSFEPEQHNHYFGALAKFVCDGLAACGYRYTRTNIMATNPEWRKTLKDWRTCFADWIEQPLLEDLLKTAIFFDLDGVGGQNQWLDELRTFVVERARNSNRFLGCLASNALNRSPPLGFFRDWVMEKNGELRETVNLKRRGTAPMVNLIRVHALAAGSCALNSFERLDDIIAEGVLSEEKGVDLRNAMEIISMVRIRHQVVDINACRQPNNNIEPKNLSDFERRLVKDAFHVLSAAQKFLNFRYHTNRQ